jgi:Raf kinase inhibitor-like YbhB/YbcL family protein
MRHHIKRFVTILIVFTTASAALTAQQAPAAQGGGGRGRGPAGPPLTLSSSALVDLQMLPAKYGCTATPANVSPPLAWTNAPAATQSFAVLVQDLEPRPMRGVQPFPHWFIWNIPATATSLPEAIPHVAELPDGSRQSPAAAANLGTIAFRSPCPPAPQVHHYVFDLFALDTKLDALASGATRDDLNTAMAGHVIGHAVMVIPFKQ